MFWDEFYEYYKEYDYYELMDLRAEERECWRTAPSVNSKLPMPPAIRHLAPVPYPSGFV